MPQEEYTWLVIVGALAAWLFGWGTGSNDVANAFGTSVGSGALTLKQAILIAIIFEFTGAMVLGRVSTSVIAGGIADIKVFQTATDCNGALTYGYGMMWTLILGGLWQGYASYKGFNVSATHTIIAGIIGFSLQFRRNGVLWVTDSPSNIGLPYGGIVPIVVTWFFAPITTGVVSSTLFYINRTLILRSPHSFERAFMVFPLLVFFTFWINIYFVFTKGAKKTFSEQNGGKGDDWSDSKSAWVSAVIAGGMSIISFLCIPLVRRWVINWDKVEQDRLRMRRSRLIHVDTENNIEAGTTNQEDPTCISQTNTENNNTESPSIQPREVSQITSSSSDLVMLKKSLEIPPDIMVDPIGNIRAQFKNLSNMNYGMDFFDDLNENVFEMHNRAEKFDPMTEKVFGFLQIFSATCVIFAHGAGEVGYMAGPLATIYDVYMNNKLNKTVSAPMWVIVISALSLVSGLATYGRNVVKAMGKDLAKITPSRGFCAETCTAMVIMVAAQYGLPTSSSQVITGGIVGIGIVEGLHGVNWRFFFEQFSSWILTMFVMGLGTALMFAQGHNAP